MLSVAELWMDVKVAAKMIAMTPEDRRAFESLELRVQTILPEEYQDCYEDVEPVSMGSAGLKYGRDGKVAWQDIWQTFCDLAMAGGPPHKGTLLEAASREEVEADPERYGQVVEEICRGIKLVTFLEAAESSVPGWVRVECGSEATAGWLARAITMENVSARCEGQALELPAGPGYRVEKEIKNVITVMAKTCHYFLDHVPAAQQQAIGDLFEAIATESALIQPALSGHGFDANKDTLLRQEMADRIQQATGLKASDVPCKGWLGLVCPSAKAAIWMMRGMVVSNVFARREETILFVPVNPMTDPRGNTVVQITSRVHKFALVRDAL